MQIVFNCGAHTTNCKRTLQALQENQSWLDENKVEVIPPKRHGNILGKSINSLNGGVATSDMEGLLLDSLLTSEKPKRAIMASPGLLGVPSQITGADGLYPLIGSRLSGLTNLFPNCEVEFFLAIRNPATLLSDVLQEVPEKDHSSFLTACGHGQLRWRDAIHRVAESLQGQRLVIWCYEDFPLIWPEVLRSLATMPPDTSVQGNLLYIDELLNEEGRKLLSSEMSSRDQMTVAQRRKLHGRLLQEHHTEDALEQEIHLPGWTQKVVDEVSRNYYSDVAEITAFPGVEFIMP